MRDPNPLRPHPHRRAAALLAVAALLLLRCTSTPSAPIAVDGFVACGEPQPIAVPVVTFAEPGGYDAYRRGPWFDAAAPLDGQARWSQRRGLPDAATLADLRDVVHQFVLHYDTTATSAQCFKVLQDVRKLSVHFLLDVDGTIYQTLDLRDKAHHATIANDGAIGVEIAHPGAFAQPMQAAMRRFYERDEVGWRLRLPDWIERGALADDLVVRPARDEVVAGEVNGKVYHQLDFTEAQYRSLAALCAALSRTFPRIRLEVPRDPDGAVVDHVLPEDELRAFDGIVGHFHVQANKQDPGPAFQWERVLAEARAHRRPRRFRRTIVASRSTTVWANATITSSRCCSPIPNTRHRCCAARCRPGSRTASTGAR